MNSYVLTLLHFNLQYCAGGLDGLVYTGATDNDSVEDAIIVESFAPVLDMLDAHPTWSFDLELQAYMVEVMAARHPEVLDHLRTLAKSGQVELVSFHYSDQLWTAYPWRDQQHSLALTAAIFSQYDLPLSSVVFTQEGQFGEGMLQRMPEFGYDIAVMPHNLYEYLEGADSPTPMYHYGDVNVIIGGSGGSGVTPEGADWQVSWHFLNDGELYATGDLNPYVGAAFKYNPDALQSKVDDLLAAEAAGQHIVSVGTFVSEVGDATTVLPPVTDGDWQPDDTGNLHRWMGGAGLWVEEEMDNAVLVNNVRAGQAVAAAEIVAGADAVEDAYKSLLLGEVSDATGWNPWQTEVQYGISHAGEVVSAAQTAIDPMCAENGAAGVMVDLANGEMIWDGIPAPDSTVVVAPPVVATVSGRDSTVNWTYVADDVDQLSLTYAAGADPVSVSFPWDGLVVATVPSLAEEMVSLDATTIAADDLALPLSLGIARLSDGLWLIKRTDSIHLAGHFQRSTNSLYFLDETTTLSGAWRFLVVRGTADRALDIARRVNETPVVNLACPVVACPDSSDVCYGTDCGCTTTPLNPLAPWFSLGLVAMPFTLVSLLRRRPAR